jgi:hypothetical protein
MYLWAVSPVRGRPDEANQKEELRVMKIVRSDRQGVYIKNAEDEGTLEFEKIVHPLAGFSNCYWDGITIKFGRKYARVSAYGGGEGWARRGSMSEGWENLICNIPIEEAKDLLVKVKTALAEENEVDREAELCKIVNTVFSRFEEE